MGWSSSQIMPHGRPSFAEVLGRCCRTGRRIAGLGGLSDGGGEGAGPADDDIQAWICADVTIRPGRAGKAPLFANGSRTPGALGRSSD